MGLIVNCAVLVFMSTCCSAFLTEPVTTNKGQIVGVRQAVRGTYVNTYYGVPYAKSPTGNLRFKAPEPVEPWDPEVKDATTRRAICPQFASVTPFQPLRTDVIYRDEDCLNLNIWVPEPNPRLAAQQRRARRKLLRRRRSTLTSDQEDSLATIVWIYGGSFTSGSINRPLYDGAYLAASTGVIVISINYRVGALGFLSLNSDITGNQGLLDQVAGLQFIYDNIAAFGGSKHSITLLGESAGAASAGLHLFSSLSQGLFTRAILESSSPLAIYAATPQYIAQFRGQQFANESGCYDPATVSECLRQLPVSEILAGQEAVGGFFTFTPAIDGVFLENSPKNLFQNIKQTEILLGVQRDEGTLFLPDLAPPLFPLSDPIFVPDNFYQGIVNTILAELGISNKIGEVLSQYHGTEGSNVGRLDAILGDALFKCPVVSFADIMSTLSTVYMYSHERLIESTPLPAWMEVPHSYNLEFVFGHLFSGALNGTEDEERLSDDIMQYWANFAISGNPNEPIEGWRRREWPKYTSTSKKHMIFDVPELEYQGNGKLNRQSLFYEIGENLRQEQCAFWAGLFQP